MKDNKPKYHLWIPSNRLGVLVSFMPKLKVRTIIGGGSSGTAVSDVPYDFGKIRTKVITSVTLKYLGEQGLKPIEFFLDWFKKMAPQVRDLSITRLDVIESHSPNLRVIFRGECSHPLIMQNIVKDGSFPGEELYDFKRMAKERFYEAGERIIPPAGLISTELIGPNPLLPADEDESVINAFQSKHPFMQVIVDRDGQWTLRDHSIKPR